MPTRWRLAVGLNTSEALEKLTLVLRLDPEPVIEDADTPAGVPLDQADVDPPGGAWPKADRNCPAAREKRDVASRRCRDHSLGGIEAELDRQVAKASLVIFDHRLHQSDKVDRLSCHRGPQLVEAADQAHVHDQPAELARPSRKCAVPRQLLVLGTQATLASREP